MFKVKISKNFQNFKYELKKLITLLVVYNSVERNLLFNYFNTCIRIT